MYHSCGGIMRKYGFYPKADWTVARNDRKILSDWADGLISDQEACRAISKNNGLRYVIDGQQLRDFATACGYWYFRDWK